MEQIRNRWQRGLLLLIVALLVELVLALTGAVMDRFSGREYQPTVIDTQAAPYVQQFDEEGLFHASSARGALHLYKLSTPVRCINFTARWISCEESRVITAQVWGKDQNSKNERVYYGSFTVAVGTGYDAHNRLEFSTHGAPSELSIYFDLNTDEIAVGSVAINQLRGARPSPMRLLLLVVGAVLLWLYQEFSMGTTLLQTGTRPARLTLGILLVSVVGISLGVSLLLCNDSPWELLSYPLKNPVDTYDPFVQQFDAFQKGQWHLDVPVGNDLLQLENPYDYSQRDGMYYLWDRAYFQGKYYSYFGIAPLLVFYYPLSIFGKLPSGALVAMLCSAMTAAFTVMCLWETVKITRWRVTYHQFALGSLACVAASLVWILQRGVQRFYYLAMLCAMAFGALFIWLALKAFFYQGKTWQRRLLFVGAGAAYAMVMLSRINSALTLAPLVVVCMIYAARKQKKAIVSWIWDMLCLGAFVLAGLGVSFWMNMSRFGSFMEFGSTYQLTVSNVSYNRLYAGGILPALYHYFFSMPHVSLSFPFLKIEQYVLDNYGHYVYIASTNVGLMSLPLYWGLWKLGGVAKNKGLSGQARAMLITGAVTLPVMAVLNFCLGGSIVRYLGDLSLVGALVATLGLWALCQRSGKSSKKTATVLFSLTLVVATLYMFSLSPDMALIPNRVFHTMASIFNL